MISRLRQRGEGKIAVIFWILVFVATGLFAKEWIPAKISDMQLSDHMKDMAQLYPRKGDKFYEEQIIARGKQLGITIDPKDVEVTKTAKRVHMKVSYVQEIDMIFHVFTWEFRHDIERDIFLI